MGCSSDSSIKEVNKKRPLNLPNQKNENNNTEDFQTLTKKIDKNKEDNKIEIKNKKDDDKDDYLIKPKVNKPNFLKDSIVSEDNKIILPPAIKEYIVEGNDNENKSYIKRKYKGITILENVKEFLHENLDRDSIKNMIYNVLTGNIVKDKTQYIKGKNLTYDQVEGIIDVLFKLVSENKNCENNEIDDERLNDVKVTIGFYDANEENIRKYIFKGKEPTEEEVENVLAQFNPNNAQTKILAVEIEDE